MTRSELASPELAAIEVHGVTRASFILCGAITAGADGGRLDRAGRSAACRGGWTADRQPVTPDGAFDKPMSKAQVLKDAGPLNKA